MRKIVVSDKFVICIELLICQLAILSFFIPTRGTVLGITSAQLLEFCFVLQLVTSLKFRVNIPKFYWIYTIIMAVCMLYHFSERPMVVHIIEIMQIVGIAYIVMVAINSRKRFESIINFIIILFTIYAVLGIIESIFHYNLFDTITGTQVVYETANGIRFGLARARGAANVSINNGMLLCLVLCLVSYKLLSAECRNKKIYLISYVLIFVNILLTLSRGIWIDLLLSQVLIFFAFKSGHKVRIAIRILFVLIAASAVLMIISPSFLDNVFKIFDEMFGSIIGTFTGSNDTSLSDEGNRIDLWSWVWYEVKDNAIWGAGFNRPFAYLTRAGAIKESIEVMWLYRLYILGFVGLAGYIFFQIGSLIYLFKNYLRKKKQQISNIKSNFDFNYIIFSGSIAYFITQFSCAGSEDLRFYYLLLALAFSYNNIDKSNIINNKIPYHHNKRRKKL